MVRYCYQESDSYYDLKEAPLNLASMYHFNPFTSLYDVAIGRLIIGASLSEPHINVKFVRLVCLSVFLSVCPYVHDTKIYKNSSNLRGTFSC